METDTVPLGCLDELEAALREPIVMRPGDVFVALSDGIVETMNPEGELFGTKRVIDVISERCDGSVAEMLAALREALTAFAGTRPADDDRTVVIVKRE
jgi:sigma-B regulation protein RsbU (phosphoserine phosphatase)